MSTLVISLGKNCQTAHHLVRLGLTTVKRLPFDTSLTDHAVLCEMLRTDFANAFQQRVGIVDHNNRFMFGHHELPAVAGVMQTWRRRVGRFRSLRQFRGHLVFMRGWRPWNPADTGQEDRDELEAALGSFGFKDFELRYIEYVEPPAGSTAWIGSDEQWEEELADLLNHGSRPVVQ